jgi:pyruvate dehydrogenase E2 component (dihydrolipoamide acetyltransferase)
MPQLGETVTEGTITRWAKKVGDSVAEDEVLFEVSTDKVDSEVPSPVGGVIAEILVAEGETVDVGTKLAVISDGAPASAAPAASAPAAEAAPAPPPPAQEPAPARPAKEAPAAPAPAAQAPPGESSEPAAADAPAPVPPSPGRSDGPGLVLSPVVRRLIAEHDLDPAAIAGTGAGGRITRSDVLAFIDSNNGRGPAKTRPAPAVAGAPSVAAFPPASPGEHDEIVPFNKIR